MNIPDLQGKTALVTGGGRGIGRSVAQLLARHGARVVVTARTAAEIEDVAGEIRARGGDAMAVPADISQDNLVAELFDAAGVVDILVNNAGIIGPVAPVVMADPAEWRRDIEINLYAVFLTTHMALPHMLRAGWGRIINVSSGAARGSTASWSAYSAAKAGVEALTKVTAVEVGEHGVRVNAVRPGIVDTEMQVEIRRSHESAFGSENLARFRGYKERGMLRHPDDPARLILWLLGPDADEVNGEILAIDDPDVAVRIGLEPMSR